MIRKSGDRFSLATNAKRLRGDHAQKKIEWDDDSKKSHPTPAWAIRAAGCRRPLVARGASNDAQRVRAAESQPLHHGDGGIVLAAGRIDTGFISGHAVD